MTNISMYGCCVSVWVWEKQTNAKFFSIHSPTRDVLSFFLILFNIPPIVCFLPFTWNPRDAIFACWVFLCWSSSTTSSASTRGLFLVFFFFFFLFSFVDSSSNTINGRPTLNNPKHFSALIHTHTRTHTRLYIYIYTQIGHNCLIENYKWHSEINRCWFFSILKYFEIIITYIYVCVCVCMYVQHKLIDYNLTMIESGSGAERKTWIEKLILKICQTIRDYFMPRG